MTKILSLLAVLAAVASFSAPVFADNGVDASASVNDAVASHNPPPDWYDSNTPGWDRQGGTMCRARNILGQTFNARGDWRTPQRWVARRALMECRQSSFPFIARTCQIIGCRQGGNGGNGDNGGPGRDMIRIRSAIYGANCDGRGGNVAGDVARSCEGRANCAYTVDVARIGDPAYGCRKDFRVEFECRGQLEQAYLAPEANGQTLQLRCGF